MEREGTRERKSESSGDSSATPDKQELADEPVVQGEEPKFTAQTVAVMPPLPPYRGTSLIRNAHRPRITVGP